MGTARPGRARVNPAPGPLLPLLLMLATACGGAAVEMAPAAESAPRCGLHDTPLVSTRLPPAPKGEGEEWCAAGLSAADWEHVAEVLEARAELFPHAHDLVRTRSDGERMVRHCTECVEAERRWQSRDDG